MTHPTENDLLALLDGELSGERRREVAAHLESCGACRAEAAALEAAARRFAQALAVVDGAAVHPSEPPHVDAAAAGARRRSDRRRRSWVVLARAAALVLAAAGAASAVIPGTPIHAWVAALARGEQEEPALPAPDPVALPTAPGSRTPSPTGVSVLPADGVLRIVVTNFAPESSVRVRVVEAAEGRVELTEEATARFRIAPGRIEVAGEGRGDVVVDLPRSTTEATVEVDGRIAVLKRGAELQLLRPALDSLQGDVSFRIGR